MNFFRKPAEWMRSLHVRSDLLRVVALAVVFLSLLVGCIALADEVHEGDTLLFDQAVLRAIHTGASDGWDAFFLTITDAGGVIGVIVISLATIATLLFKRRYRDVLFVTLGVGGAALLNVFLKFLFERPRPDLWDQLVVETSFSFPSGHAMASAAIACCLVVLFWRTRFRWYVAVAAFAYVILIGFSRLYLGVHYPTDIVVGWSVSVLWVLLIASLFKAYASRRASNTASSRT